jgi:hypothetical protein
LSFTKKPFKKHLHKKATKTHDMKEKWNKENLISSPKPEIHENK